MDALKIFSNPQFGQVRIVTDDASEKLLFCANDVTDALGYTNGRDAISRHVDKDDVAKHDIIDNLGRAQSATFITESGVYSLIFSSKQERAKEFKHWVTNEVLPSIRKTGRYEVQIPTQEKLQEQFMFAEWSAKFLNLNEASKLGIAQEIGKMVGLGSALPQAVNAGTFSPTVHAATDLLKSHNVGISTQAFNRLLESKGVVKKVSRIGKRGRVHNWMVLQSPYGRYGENQQDPNFQQQTQIRWYDNLFAELLTIVGFKAQPTFNY